MKGVSIYSACPFFRFARILLKFLAATKVFRMSMVTVIGPTPPGTGVIWPATLRTSEIPTTTTTNYIFLLNKIKNMRYGQLI